MSDPVGVGGEDPRHFGRDGLGVCCMPLHLEVNAVHVRIGNRAVAHPRAQVKQRQTGRCQDHTDVLGELILLGVQFGLIR